MVLRTSTKGTWLMTMRKRSGRMLVTAPIKRPPALPPSMTNLFALVNFCAMRNSAEEMKSVKVLSLLRIRPASCQGLPSSPPPRMCAMAKMTPRSRRLRRLERNPIMRARQREAKSATAVGRHSHERTRSRLSALLLHARRPKSRAGNRCVHTCDFKRASSRGCVSRCRNQSVICKSPETPFSTGSHYQ